MEGDRLYNFLANNLPKLPEDQIFDMYVKLNHVGIETPAQVQDLIDRYPRDIDRSISYIVARLKTAQQEAAEEAQKKAKEEAAKKDAAKEDQSLITDVRNSKDFSYNQFPSRRIIRTDNFQDFDRRFGDSGFDDRRFDEDFSFNQRPPTSGRKYGGDLRVYEEDNVIDRSRQPVGGRTRGRLPRGDLRVDEEGKVINRPTEDFGDSQRRIIRTDDLNDFSQLDESRFDDRNFRESRFDDRNFRESRFDDRNFRESRFGGSRFDDRNFRESRFGGSRDSGDFQDTDFIPNEEFITGERPSRKFGASKSRFARHLGQNSPLRRVSMTKRLEDQERMQERMQERRLENQAGIQDVNIERLEDQASANENLKDQEERAVATNERLSARRSRLANRKLPLLGDKSIQSSPSPFASRGTRPLTPYRRPLGTSRVVRNEFQRYLDTFGLGEKYQEFVAAGIVNREQLFKAVQNLNSYQGEIREILENLGDTGALFIENGEEYTTF